MSNFGDALGGAVFVHRVAHVCFLYLSVGDGDDRRTFTVRMDRSESESHLSVLFFTAIILLYFAGEREDTS